MLKLAQGLQVIEKNISQSVTEITTAYLPMAILNNFLCNHILYFINLILFVYQKHAFVQLGTL